MISEKLYDKAFDYFETKLWQKLYDTDLFAVQLENGVTGYCTVMGNLGECISLALYVGDEGLASFYDIISNAYGNLDEDERLELMLSQNCIQCSLENKADLFPDELKEFNSYSEKTGRKVKGRKKYIHFSRYSPYCVPWYVKDKKDIAHIEMALDAALEVAAKLKEKSNADLGFSDDEQIKTQRTIPLLEKTKDGFEWKTTELPEKVEVPYFEPKLSEEAAKKMEAYERNGLIECKIFRMPLPVQNKKTEAPRYPLIIMCIDRKSGMIVSAPKMIASENEDLELFDFFSGTFISQKMLPEKLIAFDDRTVQFLKNFCFQTSTPIIVEPTKLADDAFYDMMGFMGHGF